LAQVITCEHLLYHLGVRRTCTRSAAMISRQIGGLFIVLVVPARALVRLQMEAGAEADSEAMVSMSTLSTEEWEKVHETTYEKEFTIELNMTAAKQGVTIGAELWSQSDHDPLVVLKKADAGLVENWNRAHPDRAVQIGDEISMVGDFQWNHKNEMFIRHLKEQFGVLRKQEAGMANFLVLGIRRPKSSRAQAEPPADAAQVTPRKAESLLGTDAQVTRVFEVQLDPSLAYMLVDQNFNTPASLTGGSMTVGKISPGSPLEAFNAANPTNRVQVGDAVVAVNGAAWSGNAMQFLKMHKTVQASHKAGKPETGKPSTLPLKLRLQRRQA